MSLIVSDGSEPTTSGGSEGRLGSAASLLRLLDPEPAAARLDVVPRKVVQRDELMGWSGRLRRKTLPALATVVIHLGFAAIFAFLLTWREDAERPEVEIPVEVVTETPLSHPAPAKPPPEPPNPSIPAVSPEPEPLAPKPQPQARQESKAEDPTPVEPRPILPPAPAPPPLIAPPPDAAPSATQAEVNKPGNLEPDQHQIDAATHERRPSDVPDVLSTADPEATFAVPAEAEPKPEPPKPAPAAPDKVPSETEKLAAALPTDTSAMPSSFRAVLSGTGALINAAYKGVVFGRLGRDPGIADKARRQHLKGQVMLSFSIGDRGELKNLSILQTSGNAALDALGLAMIRAAAPFPPPPPDAQRAFTPALTFGE